VQSAERQLLNANPLFESHLAEHSRSGALLDGLDPETLYDGGARGYTDYPVLAATEARHWSTSDGLISSALVPLPDWSGRVC
jgi:hypothetical protein